MGSMECCMPPASGCELSDRVWPLLRGWRRATPSSKSTGCCLTPSCRWSRSSAAGCPSWWESGGLGFDYIIRFRGVVYVEDAAGERRKAKAWLGTAGRMRVFQHARVTAQRHLVPVVVCVQDKAMKEPWCLVSSRQDLTGVEIKVAYGRRFTVEETFRDVKNPRLGLGR